MQPVPRHDQQQHRDAHAADVRLHPQRVAQQVAADDPQQVAEGEQGGSVDDHWPRREGGKSGPRTGLRAPRRPGSDEPSYGGPPPGLHARIDFSPRRMSPIASHPALFRRLATSPPSPSPPGRFYPAVIDRGITPGRIGWIDEAEEEKTMEPRDQSGCSAFAADRRIATGGLVEVIRAAKSSVDPGVAVVIFDDESGETIELDFRGTVEEVLARVTPARPMTESPPRGPGRPRLGVVSREVTLLPSPLGLAERPTRRGIGRDQEARRGGLPGEGRHRPGAASQGRGVPIPARHGRRSTRL